MHGGQPRAAGSCSGSCDFCPPVGDLNVAGSACNLSFRYHLHLSCRQRPACSCACRTCLITCRDAVGSKAGYRRTVSNLSPCQNGCAGLASHRTRHETKLDDLPRWMCRCLMGLVYGGASKVLSSLNWLAGHAVGVRLDGKTGIGRIPRIRLHRRKSCRQAGRRASRRVGEPACTHADISTYPRVCMLATGHVGAFCDIMLTCGQPEGRSFISPPGADTPVPDLPPDPAPAPRACPDHALWRVCPKGKIAWRSDLVFVSQAVAGEPVGIVEVETGDWIVRFCKNNLDIPSRKTGRLHPPCRILFGLRQSETGASGGDCCSCLRSIMSPMSPVCTLAPYPAIAPVSVVATVLAQHDVLAGCDHHPLLRFPSRQQECAAQIDRHAYMWACRPDVKHRAGAGF